VEFHLGELFPRVGFIVTNLETGSRAVVRFYNKRRTAEERPKEGKQAVKMTRLSCHRFRSNEVRKEIADLRTENWRRHVYWMLPESPKWKFRLTALSWPVPASGRALSSRRLES
jgi:hypothetical protein